MDENNLQATDPQLAQPVVGRPAKKLSKRWYITGLVLLIIVISAGLASYFHWHTNNQSSLGQLNTYTLAGSAHGQGISFEKPAELTVDPDTTATQLPSQVGFSYAPNGYSVAYIAAASPATSASDYSSSSIGNIPKSLAEPASKAYTQAVTPLKFFVAGLFAPGVNISYSVARPFTNPHINSNAWQFDLNITSPSTSRTSQGTLVYALGKNSYYFFMIEAHSSDWQANQSTWNQILSSIKIDQ